MLIQHNNTVDTSEITEASPQQKHLDKLVISDFYFLLSVEEKKGQQ